MKKKNISPAFKIGLGVFVSTLKPKLNFARRDIKEFETFGIDATKIDCLEKELNGWADITSDDELIGDQMLATKTKDAAAAELSSALGAILTRAANNFGTDSAYYRKFGVTSLSILVDGELCAAAKRVKRVAETYLEDLRGHGLSQQIIDDMDQKRVAFERALGFQEDAIADRDIASENRIEKANAIYSEIAKLCQTGKQIWAETNEAKYNDYIIYDTPSGKADATVQTTSATEKA
jgi:hypothetical protein